MLDLDIRNSVSFEVYEISILLIISSLNSVNRYDNAIKLKHLSEKDFDFTKAAVRRGFSK